MKKQQMTVFKSEYAPQRSNVRVRMVSVNSNGEMTGTLATLGGDWIDENCILVSSTSCEQSTDSLRALTLDLTARSRWKMTHWVDISRRQSVCAWRAASMGLLPGAAAAAVLSVLLGLYLLLAAGHRANETEQDGIRLRFFDRWPVILLGVLLLVAYCAFQLIWEGFNYTCTAPTAPAYTTVDAAEGHGQLPGVRH